MREKLRANEALICIIGLRYVGLPLAEAFVRKLKVSGFSTDAGKVKISKKKNNKVDKLCIV
ncbi:hypothetical protein M1O16_03940 [Dehalococcoidia bacterium]|nr:hypothetical protein [Dehalococcoidia bacterium]